MRQPRHRIAGEEATSGRGLSIVEALSDEWGVSQNSSGKTVWALLTT